MSNSRWLTWGQPRGLTAALGARVHVETHCLLLRPMQITCLLALWCPLAVATMVAFLRIASNVEIARIMTAVCQRTRVYGLQIISWANISSSRGTCPLKTFVACHPHHFCPFFLLFSQYLGVFLSVFFGVDRFFCVEPILWLLDSTQFLFRSKYVIYSLFANDIVWTSPTGVVLQGGLTKCGQIIQTPLFQIQSSIF